MQCAARSSGRVRLKDPRKDFAKGVRELATTTASLIVLPFVSRLVGMCYLHAPVRCYSISFQRLCGACRSRSAFERLALHDEAAAASQQLHDVGRSLVGRTGVEGRLRIVLDPQLNGL